MKNNFENNTQNYVMGRNAVSELLKSGRDIDKLFVRRDAKGTSLSVIIGEANKRRIPFVECDNRKLDEMANGVPHQGIIASVAAIEYATIDDMLALAESRNEKPLLVIADGIEDPQNLGALIRSAEIAGAHGVIIPKRRAAGAGGSVERASAGAIAHVPIAKVTNLAATVKELKEKGLWIYASEVGGSAYYDTDFTSAAAIVLGSEGNGVSHLLKELSDFIVTIPMYGKVNSLNVSAAAAVVLCEAARQRHLG